MTKSLLQNINYMKRFIHVPCATPSPIIMAETFVEAASLELFELESWSTWDLLSKRIKALSAKGAVVADFAKSAHGRRASGDAHARRAGLTAGDKRFMWGAADAFVTLRFYFLLGELGVDFLMRWTTLMYEAQQCEFPGQCYGALNFTPGEIYFGDVDSPALFNNVVTLPGVSAGGRDILISPGHAIGMAVDFRCEKWSLSPEDIAYSVSLVDVGSGEAADTASRSGSAVQSDSHTAVWGGVGEPGFGSTRHYQVVIHVSKGYAQCTGGSVHISSDACVANAPRVPKLLRQFL